jgi:hypothetical protein
MYQSRDYIRHLTALTEPSMRYDFKESYDIWKERAREKLSELLGLPFSPCMDEMKILSEKNGFGYRQINFHFQSEEGYFVPCALLIPDGAPRPLAICLQGHSTGMHVSCGEEKFNGDDELIRGGRDFALQALREGYSALILEPRYMGSCGSTENGAPLCARKNAALPSLLLGRTAIGERVWDVMRAIDTVKKYFANCVDTDHILCMGNSGGGTVTFYAACMDDRIKTCMPSCSVCEFEDSIVPFHHCCCNYIPGIRRYFEMGDLASLIADRSLVIVCGVKDPDFPLHGVVKSYERARAVFKALNREKRCVLVKGSEGHRFYPEEAWPVANDLVLRHL